MNTKMITPPNNNNRTKGFHLRQMKATLAAAVLGLIFHSSEVQATMIVDTSFTTAEGYTNGALNGQTVTGGSAWWASSATRPVVNATTGVVNRNVTFGEYGADATYGAPIATSFTSFTSTLDFTIGGLGTSVPAANEFLVYSRFGTSSNASGAIQFMLYRPTSLSNSYTLRFSLAAAAQGTLGDQGTDSSSFLNSTIGDDGTLGDVSDNLQMSFTLTRGLDATNWAAVGTLSNLTTSTLVQTLSMPIVSLSGAYDSSNLYGGFGFGTLGASLTNALPGMTFSSYSIEAVPEPSTWALVVAAGLALGTAAWRRRCIQRPAEALPVCKDRV